MYDNADFEQESRGVVRLASASTASYAVILDNKGDCQFGIGDLKIHDQLTVDKVQKKIVLSHLSSPSQTRCSGSGPGII